MPRKTLAILTNARAADQRSMIGYGELVLEAAQQSGNEVIEFRSASLFGRLLPAHIGGLPRKLANNLDRFFLTPLKLAGGKADIVHVVDPGNVVYLPLIRHRRAIVTVHDMIPYLARDGKLQGWQPTRSGRWLMDRITARLAKVDHIVCVSHATKRDLLSYVDIAEERVSVIHNAVFQPMEPASDEACAEFRSRHALPADAPLILHVGRNWYKNREMVLKVAARVREERPEIHLVMVGALTPPLAALAERLGLSDALHVLERVERDIIADLYTTASILLFPSHYEGFGLPVLEAQMCGTPVVCSDAGALPEVAIKGCTVVPRGAVEEYACAVMRWLSTKSEGNELFAFSSFKQEHWRQENLQIYLTLQAVQRMEGIRGKHRSGRPHGTHIR